MLDELRDLYQEVILDHGRSPRNFRRLDAPTCQALGHNPMCGDTLTVFLCVDADEVIRDVTFEGKGCAISMASASIMTEVLKDRPLAEARRLFEAFHRMCTTDVEDPADLKDVDPDVLERLQVLSGVRSYPIRVKCATLPWHTLSAAVTGEVKASNE